MFQLIRCLHALANSKMDVSNVSDILGVRLMYDGLPPGASAAKGTEQAFNPKEENEHLSRILDFLLKYGLEVRCSGGIQCGTVLGLLHDHRVLEKVTVTPHLTILIIH